MSQPSANLPRFINLLLAGLLTGNEFGGWVGFHPALATLPQPSQIQAERAVTRRFGAVMPLFMTATILSCVPVLAGARDRRSGTYRTALGGVLCYVAMLGVTFVGNMPINRRVLAATAEAPPADWYTLRRRWDRWHMLRNGLNILGFGLLIGSALTADSHARSGSRP